MFSPPRLHGQSYKKSKTRMEELRCTTELDFRLNINKHFFLVNFIHRKERWLKK